MVVYLRDGEPRRGWNGASPTALDRAEEAPRGSVLYGMLYENLLYLLLYDSYSTLTLSRCMAIIQQPYSAVCHTAIQLIQHTTSYTLPQSLNREPIRFGAAGAPLLQQK